MTLTVTIKDDETGEETISQVSNNDYLVVCSGDCYVSHTQSFPKFGTYILTIEGQRMEAKKAS